MPIPPGNALLTFVFGGEAAGPGGCVTTMGVSHVVEETPSEFAQEMYDAFGTTILDVLSGFVSLTECRVRMGTAEGEFVTSAFGSSTGAVGGDGEPPNLAWPIVKFTELGGRANKGRMFIPGLPDGAVEPNGAIETVARAGMNDALDAWVVELIAADAFPVLFHPTTEAPPTEIISIVCGNLAYSRGTRLRG